jgi:predicted permease
VIAILALAIGANTGLFSLVNAIVLRKLPVQAPDRLALLQARDERGQQTRPIYYAAYSELAKLPVFKHVALYSGGGLFQIEVRGALNEGLIEASTPGLFETLGLRPYLGRFFTEADSPADRTAAAVAVLSFDFWRRAFGGDPKAIGETVLIDGTPAVVIGVTPPEYKGFYVDGGFGFSVPLTFLLRQMGRNPTRPVRGLNAIARLADGTSLQQAHTAVNAAWPAIRDDAVPSGLSETERKDLSTQTITMESLATGISGLRRQYRDPLLVVFAITAALLLIAGANLSGLLIARVAARHQELAICIALGASRARMIEQLGVESLSLSMLGAFIGAPLAWWTTRAATTLLWVGSGPMSQSLEPDVRVFAVTVALAMLTGMLMTVLPGLIAMRRWSQGALGSDRTVVRTSGRWGRTLLVAQVTVSMVLLVGAGLFVSSLINLRHLDAGVRPEGLRWSRLFAVPNGYRNQNDAAYYPELVRRLSELPGIQSVALASMFPTYFGLGNLVVTQPVAPTEQPNPAEAADSIMENITPTFFATAGIPLSQGRDFTWNDDTQHPAVVIINESLRRKIFPRDNPIGRRIRIGNDPRRNAVEVVGIVHDAAIGSYTRPDMPVAFRPRMQELQLARAPVLLVRSSGESAVSNGDLRSVIAGLGHEYARGFYSLDEQIDRALLPERLLAALSSFFAGLGVLIAFVGLYGALAYAVSRRTREIGVRMALGASRFDVIRMIVGEGLVVTVSGIVVGVPTAMVAGVLIRSFLFGLQPSDPSILIAASAFFAAVGASAGVRPAVRAASLDPMTVLRNE